MPAYIPPFLGIYTSPADEVYIHGQLQYISNCRCSIYSFFGDTFLHGLTCRLNVRGDEFLAIVGEPGRFFPDAFRDGFRCFPYGRVSLHPLWRAVFSGSSHCRKSRMFGSSR